MKTRSLQPICTTIAIGVSLLTLAVTSFAQPVPSWKYITWTEIEANDLNDVTSVVENWTKFVKEQIPDYTPYEYMTGADGKAYFVRFVKEFNDIPKSDEEFRRALEKYISLGLPDMSAQWQGGVNRADSSVWELRADLSYLPAETMAAFQEPFRKLVVFHVKRDQLEAWEEATRALNAADRAAGIKKPRFVFEAKIGKDLPAFSYVIPAKDVFDYYAGLANRTSKRQSAISDDPIEALERCTRLAEHLHLTMHPEGSKLPTPE